MAVTIACTPTSPAAKKSFARIDVAGLTLNDATAYDISKKPSEPEIRYYLTFEVGGAIVGKSYVFAPNGGKHTFNNYIFPSAGSYTVRVSKAADNSSVQTLSVTVS